jgi:hypothetical protein
MTIQELILLNSDKVRRDSSLMAFYIESFVATFNYKPTCTGCSFSSDWRKLVNHVNKKENLVTLQKNINTMSTFKLKKVSNVILAYKKDGATHRKYDNLLNEDFAIAYLTNGTEAEIEQRKKLFAVLPEGLNAVKEEEVLEIPTMDNTAKEMKAYAKLKGIDVSGLQNKKELPEAIEKAQ